MLASLNGADEATLMTRVDEMLAVRRSIAERKVNCRDNMKKILNDEQYNLVRKLQEEVGAARSARAEIERTFDKRLQEVAGETAFKAL